MSTIRRPHPRPLLIPNGTRKHNAEQVQIQNSLSPNAGNLTPDLPKSRPSFPVVQDDEPCWSKIGKYILLEKLEGCNNTFKAVCSRDGERFICKVFGLDKYQKSLTPYFRVGSHEYIREIHEIILGSTNAYVFFEQNHGDLHSYVRSKKRLGETEARNLFSQIVEAVAHCHESGVVLRDLKLRKFVFTNEEKSSLVLEDVEDSFVMSEDDWSDEMREKHGCPAYVSPEILNAGKSYSGRCSDIWSLGVILYTMLVGRYPFHDSDPRSLFLKIQRGQFSVPDSISSKAKCLIRTLLRREPEDRLTAEEINDHPWFNSLCFISGSSSEKRGQNDQTVPDIFLVDDESSFFS